MILTRVCLEGRGIPARRLLFRRDFEGHCGSFAILTRSLYPCYSLLMRDAPPSDSRLDELMSHARK